MVLGVAVAGRVQALLPPPAAARSLLPRRLGASRSYVESVRATLQNRVYWAEAVFGPGRVPNVSLTYPAVSLFFFSIFEIENQGILLDSHILPCPRILPYHDGKLAFSGVSVHFFFLTPFVFGINIMLSSML